MIPRCCVDILPINETLLHGVLKLLRKEKTHRTNNMKNENRKRVENISLRELDTMRGHQVKNESVERTDKHN